MCAYACVRVCVCVCVHACACECLRVCVPQVVQGCGSYLIYSPSERRSVLNVFLFNLPHLSTQLLHPSTHSLPVAITKHLKLAFTMFHYGKSKSFFLKAKRGVDLEAVEMDVV